LDALAIFLRDSFPGSIVTAEYGFGSGIHPDLTYVSMRIGVGWLDRFFRESVEQRIFIPGSSDMYVRAPDKQLTVQFCHEGDLHVSASDASVLAKLLATPPFSTFEFTQT
jgi:hypothetical protein